MRLLLLNSAARQVPGLVRSTEIGRPIRDVVANLELLELIAKPLDDKLTAAEQSANAEALKQAVAKGLITQAQADQYTTNGDRRFLDWNLFAQNGIDYDTLLANALGITKDQLTAAYAKAYTTRIDAQVTAGSLTQAQADLLKGQYTLANSSKFQSSMQSAFTAAVNQAVTDGVITQAQADAILKNSANTNFGGMFMGGRGGFDGMGGPGGGRGGQAFAQDLVDAPQKRRQRLAGTRRREDQRVLTALNNGPSHRLRRRWGAVCFAEPGAHGGQKRIQCCVWHNHFTLPQSHIATSARCVFGLLTQGVMQSILTSEITGCCAYH